MKCPLMCIACFHTGYGLGIEETDCLKERCAWWDAEGGCCSELSRVRELRLIRELLKDIRDEMPDEG